MRMGSDSYTQAPKIFCSETRDDRFDAVMARGAAAERKLAVPDFKIALVVGNEQFIRLCAETAHRLGDLRTVCVHERIRNRDGDGISIRIRVAKIFGKKFPRVVVGMRVTSAGISESDDEFYARG